MGRGQLSLLWREHRPGAESRRRRDAARDRCSRGGDARAAAGTQARRDPRPRRSRARPPARGGGADDRGRGRQAAQGRPGRGRARDVDVHVRRGRGPKARGRDGADGRLAGRRRQARLHAPPADRRRRSDLSLQLSAQPRRPQSRAGTRGGLRRRAQARLADPVLGASPRRADDGRRPAARLAERPRRTCVGDRRRAGRGRARSRDHVHRLRRGRLAAGRAGAAKARQPRARERDARDRRGRRRPRGRRDAARGQRLLVRRPELHLGAADLRAARRLPRARLALRAQGRGSSCSAIRSTKRPTSGR